MSTIKYMPIDPDIYEIIEGESNEYIKVFYFGLGATIEESKGDYLGIRKEPDGEFLLIKDDKSVRLDRIISFNGKPGPAFEEYDNYSINCTSCLMGFEEKK